MSRAQGLKNWLRSHGSLHLPDGRPPLFLCGIPRGGSTWIMEALSTRPETRMIAEPFNLRVPEIAGKLGGPDWGEMGGPRFTQLAAKYLRDIESGKIRFLNPNPLVMRRFITRRSLYKIIHLPASYACELAADVGATALVLLRHPAPVALSRKAFPLLDDSETSPFAQAFNPEQQDLLRRIRKQGSHLERGVAAWCLHFQGYLAAMSSPTVPDTLLTYEEMLTNAPGVLARLENVLGENFPAKVHTQLKRPSRVLSKSDQATQSVLTSRTDGDARTRHLLGRWMDALDGNSRDKGQEILDVFGVRAYDFSTPFPHLNRPPPPT